MTMAMKLEGTFDSKRPHFRLRNYFDEILDIRGIHLAIDPPDNLLVEDIKVGRNSQIAHPGVFKAEILNRLPHVRFDSIPSGGFDVGIVFKHVNERQAYGDDRYVSKIVIDLSPKADKQPRGILCPAGKTMVAGKLTEVVTTRRLFETIEKGVVKMSVIRGPDISEYQEAPKSVIQVELRNGRLRPEKAIPFHIGDSFSASFEGDGAETFVPEDIVGILEIA